MATLAEVGDGGCVEAFPNGTLGQVLTIGADGNPTWVAAGGDDQTAAEVPATATAPYVGSTVQDLLDTISVHARRTYAQNQSGTNLGSTTPTAPVSAPTGPVSGEVLIERYGDALAIWEFDGTNWVLRGLVRDCCPTAPATIPAAAFANPNAPTIAEVAAWAAAWLPTAKTGQQIVYPLNGTTDDPNYVWTIDGDGTVTNIENATFFDANEIEGAGTAASPFGTRLMAAGLTTSSAVIAAGAWANPAFSAVEYETDAGMASTGAASGFIIPITGYYHFEGYLHLIAAFNGPPPGDGYQVSLGLWIDGAFFYRLDDYFSDIARPVGAQPITISIKGSCNHYVNAGSTVELRVFVFVGNGNVTVDGSAAGSWFHVNRVH